MRNVTGTIFRNDRPVSDFSGDVAVSKKDSSVLSLEGKVKVTSRDPIATLTCRTLEWHGDEDVVLAKGNVRMESQGYEFGAAPVLLSSPDLSEVATPKLYAKGNMEVKKKLAVTIASAAVLAAAQQGSLVLRGKDGNLEIRNMADFNLRIDPKNPNRRLIHATGSPVRGFIQSQKMNAEANEINAFAHSGEGRSLLLETAILTGDVKIVANRPSRSAASGQEQTVTLETPKATYTRDLEKVAFEQKVLVVQSDPGASQSFRITGTDGTLVLYPPGQAPSARRTIRSLQLNGPVVFQLKSRREVREGTPPVTKWLPFTIDGKGQELTYDDASRKLVLNIGVQIDSDDPMYPITSTARKMTITLDELGNPVEIQGEGEPGVTTATQRPPGRRR